MAAPGTEFRVALGVAETSCFGTITLARRTATGRSGLVSMGRHKRRKKGGKRVAGNRKASPEVVNKNETLPVTV